MPEETAASIPEVIGVTDEAASALIEEITADLIAFPDLGVSDDEFPPIELPEFPPIEI
mgnify:CR=1 FL=1